METLKTYVTTSEKEVPGTFNILTLSKHTVAQKAKKVTISPIFRHMYLDFDAEHSDSESQKVTKNSF